MYILFSTLEDRFIKFVSDCKISCTCTYVPHIFKTHNNNTLTINDYQNLTCQEVLARLVAKLKKSPCPVPTTRPSLLSTLTTGSIHRPVTRAPAAPLTPTTASSLWKRMTKQNGCCLSKNLTTRPSVAISSRAPTFLTTTAHLLIVSPTSKFATTIYQIIAIYIGKLFWSSNYLITYIKSNLVINRSTSSTSNK